MACRRRGRFHGRVRSHFGNARFARAYVPKGAPVVDLLEQFNKDLKQGLTQRKLLSIDDFLVRAKYYTTGLSCTDWLDAPTTSLEVTKITKKHVSSRVTLSYQKAIEYPMGFRMVVSTKGSSRIRWTQAHSTSQHRVLASQKILLLVRVTAFDHWKAPSIKDESFQQYMNRKTSFYHITQSDRLEGDECTCPPALENGHCKHGMGNSLTEVPDWYVAQMKKKKLAATPLGIRQGGGRGGGGKNKGIRDALDMSVDNPEAKTTRGGQKSGGRNLNADCGKASVRGPRVTKRGEQVAPYVRSGHTHTSRARGK